MGNIPHADVIVSERGRDQVVWAVHFQSGLTATRLLSKPKGRGRSQRPLGFNVSTLTPVRPGVSTESQLRPASEPFEDPSGAWSILLSGRDLRFRVYLLRNFGELLVRSTLLVERLLKKIGRFV